MKTATSTSATSSSKPTQTSSSEVCQKYLAAKQQIKEEVAQDKAQDKPISEHLTGQWSAVMDDAGQQKCQFAQIERLEQGGLPLGAFMVAYQKVFEQIGAPDGVTC